MKMFNPNRSLGFFVFVKLLKINDKGKEKPKIFSYCDLMTHLGLITWSKKKNGCLECVA